MHGTGKVNGEEIILKSDNETTPDSSVLLNVKLTLHKYCRKDIWSHYINIVEKTYGKKPSHFACDSNVSGTTQAIDLIVQLYLDHSSINLIQATSKNQIRSITSSNNVCGTSRKIFKFKLKKCT